MTNETYLRSRLRRGRWFHYYRRNGMEKTLGVHGLDPNDPRVKAAYWAEHARWQDRPAGTVTPRANTFAWAVDLYRESRHWKDEIRDTTRKTRDAILRRYVAAHGDRPLSSITADDIQAGLYNRPPFAALNELKTLKPVFEHMKRLRFIPKNPCNGVELDKPKTKGHPTAGAEEIAAYQARWSVGTVERLTFDLALYTGAARADLCRIGRRNIKGGILTFNRQKTGTLAEVPLKPELAKVIASLPDIAPAFILNAYGKPYAAESLGNLFRRAAVEAGITARLHGLRKAFCVYWAERGATTHQIAAMAGHMSLAEVERYTRAADRTRIVKLLIEG